MTTTQTRPTRPAPAGNDGLWRAVPIIVTVVTVGVTALIEPSVITDIFASGQATLVTLGVAAGLFGLAALLRRAVAVPWLRAAVFVAVQLAIASVLLLPYLRTVEVNEALPGLDAAAAVADAPADAVTERAADEEVGPAPVDDAEAPAPASSAAAEPAPAATAAAPTLVASGALVGIDHRAAGDAGIYTLADGSALVRLEEIDVENGPDYRVYLVPAAGAETPTDGALDLGPMKGNVGSHNYELPAGTALDGDLTVLIWCRAFAVPIAHAPLA